MPDPVDVLGTWSADFLVNTSETTSGQEVNPFGELTFGAAAYQSSSDQYVGKATMVSTVYAPQGSLDNPTLDASGEILDELVGTATLRGTWESPVYEGSTSFDLLLNCEEVELSAQRPDLMAVCGSPGFDASVFSSCTRPEGATTIQCSFGASDIVFHRK